MIEGTLPLFGRDGDEVNNWSSRLRAVSASGEDQPSLAATRQALRKQNAQNGYVIENGDAAASANNTENSGEVQLPPNEELLEGLGSTAIGGIF